MNPYDFGPTYNDGDWVKAQYYGWIRILSSSWDGENWVYTAETEDKDGSILEIYEEDILF